MPRPTIDDVAHLSGVSLATVSRALRGLPNVAPDTRRRVEEAATALGYRADPNASRLAAGTTGIIAVLTDGLGLGAAAVVAGVESATDGHDVTIRTALRDRPTAVVDAILALGARSDAVVVVGLHLTPEEVEVVAEHGILMLTVGTATDGVDAIVPDHAAAASRAVYHLANLGHDAVVLVDVDPDTSLPGAPGTGWREGAHSAGALRGFDPVVVATVDTLAGGAEALDQVLGAPEVPSAVLATGHEAGLGLLLAARRRGVAIPGDLSVVGMVPSDVAVPAGLTTVVVDLVEVGRMAVARVLARSRDGGIPTHEVVVPDLVVGDTTARPQGRPTPDDRWV